MTFEILYKLKKDEYFKLAKADGWDKQTGNTINYRENIGKVVKAPGNTGKDHELCTSTVIHATKDPLKWLGYNGIPCSLFVVEGSPVISDDIDKKAGFAEFKVLKEIPSSRFDRLFGFKYSEIINPFDPRLVMPPSIGDKQFKELVVWGSIRGSIRDSIWGSIQGSVWDSIQGSIRGSIQGSIHGSIQGSILDSEYAYIGTLFPSVTEWKYVKNEPGKYPFQSAVNLIKQGIVPVFDGKEWYLVHPKKDAKADILWKGSIEVARRAA